MSKKNKPNIVWVVVDSVRSYSGANDSRDFLEIFYKKSIEGTRFFNVQTSAPSTVMSTSAMLSGVESIKHSITYDRFNANTNKISYLKDFISPQGYNSYFITFFPEGFKLLGDVFDGVTSRKSSKSPPENRFWKNNEITQVLKDLVNKKIIKEPFLLYLNYNCRNDPNTSKEVEKGIDFLKSEYNKQDIYFILNSDHGYPDPQKNLKESIPLLGHDLVMTEDNITTPLIIIGKNFKSYNKVYERVGLIDISDLIKSIISNKINSNKLYQLNLGKYHNNSIYSTWNRYIAQPNGKVCLVKNNIKLIYDLDTQEKLFYQIKSKEVNNDWVVEESKLKSNDIKKYYDEVRILEEDLKYRYKNIEDFFSNKLKNKILKEWRIRGLNKIILIGKFTPLYKKIIENILIDDLRFFCFEINNLSREGRDFFKNNIRSDYKCIYVASGTSISRWLREIIFFNIRFNQLLFFSDFDLNRPESILMIYRYIPKLIYQLFKSFKAWGFKNTIRIIVKKI